MLSDLFRNLDCPNWLTLTLDLLFGGRRSAPWAHGCQITNNIVQLKSTFDLQEVKPVGLSKWLTLTFDLLLVGRPWAPGPPGCHHENSVIQLHFTAENNKFRHFECRNRSTLTFDLLFGGRPRAPGASWVSNREKFCTTVIYTRLQEV